ncbi:MAG: GNAT family N-acetyltransferase [Candidatus Eisenbacteria bacterium]|nr:GNAT family N-acetyltransferase [Candidatus Eisenbacteria bacterium]
MSDEFEVRAYRPGDEAAIIELFERTFGRTMGASESARHWRWEFLESPQGRQAILLAFAQGRLAAHYAVMPLKLQIDDREHDAALSLDTATDAAFRGRGLFQRLAAQVYREQGESGAVAVFGFPNAKSGPTIFSRMGWVELKPFPLMLKPLKGAATAYLSPHGPAARLAAPIAERFVSLAFRDSDDRPTEFTVEEIGSFPADTDALWERARRGKRICVVRNRAHLEWRYALNPDRPYGIRTLRERGQLVGTIVTRRVDRFGLRSGFVVDMLCEENRPDVALALVRCAEGALRREGAELLVALMFPGTVARGALARCGFIPVPRVFHPQRIHFGVRALAADARLTTPSSWYVTWGDSDVV